VANVLLTGCRRGRWDGPAADRSFSALRDLPVDLVDGPADLDTAWELSRRYDQHPVCDMLYVALAQRRGEQLLTADAALASRLTLLDFVVLVR
jgi:predicted nucleic acid-binding protein